MAVTTFDPTDGGQASPEQIAAETAALEQGEKIIQAQEEDRATRLETIKTEQEEVALIAGKFKSQEDLVRAYEELQKKMGSSEPEEGEEPAEDVLGDPEEEDNSVSATVEYMNELGREYEVSGELSDEAVERLGAMDPKELIQAYLSYNSQAKSAQLQQSQVDSIMQVAGGAQQYADMIQWAGSNLPEEEVNNFNAVTSTNNPVAIKFAVEALTSKYRGAVGYEADLVTGSAPSPGVKGFRSHAELARAIADPRYSSDPAYREDVEERLSRSKDLL